MTNILCVIVLIMMTPVSIFGLAYLFLPIFIHHDSTVPTSSSTWFTVTKVVLLCLETRFKQTLTADWWARVNHKEKGYAKFSEVEIYSHLWYQQTGTPRLRHHTKHHAASQAQFSDMILSVISSSDNKP